jgi:hypothetical protein
MGPNPTDRARPGSKHHLITEAQGIPLAVILTGANRHDVTQLHALVDAIPPIAGKRGRPLSKPASFRATGATITTNTAVRYTQSASPLKSPDAASRTAADWAKPAGLSSAPSHGFTTFDDCASASNAWRLSTKPS